MDIQIRGAFVFFLKKIQEDILLIFYTARYSRGQCNISSSLQRMELVGRGEEILIRFTNKDVIAGVCDGRWMVSFSLYTGGGKRAVDSAAALQTDL